MATWQEHIERYTREIETGDLSSSHLGEIIAESVNEWVEEAGLELLYKHAVEKVSIPNGGLDCAEHKIIKVFREDKVCLRKPFDEYSLFSDSKSIHHATDYTPVFYVEHKGDPDVTGDVVGPYLQVYPELASGEHAYAFLFTYSESISPDTSTGTTASAIGLPPRMVPLVALSSAEKVLNHKLGMMIHEEEDAEISSLIQNQISVIRTFVQAEMERLGIGKAGGPQNPMTMYTGGQQ